MKDFIKGAIFGAVVAGVAVAFTTPKKGEELCHDVVDFTNDTYNKTKEMADNFKQKSHDIYVEKKDNINKKIDELKNEKFNSEE